MQRLKKKKKANWEDFRCQQSEWDFILRKIGSWQDREGDDQICLLERTWLQDGKKGLAGVTLETEDQPETTVVTQRPTDGDWIRTLAVGMKRIKCTWKRCKRKNQCRNARELGTRGGRGRSDSEEGAAILSFPPPLFTISLPPRLQCLSSHCQQLHTFAKGSLATGARFAHLVGKTRVLGNWLSWEQLALQRSHPGGQRTLRCVSSIASQSSPVTLLSICPVGNLFDKEPFIGCLPFLSSLPRPSPSVSWSCFLGKKKKDSHKSLSWDRLLEEPKQKASSLTVCATMVLLFTKLGKKR